MIAVTNGLLNPEKGTLTPYTPNEFVVQQIPVEFKPEAECPVNLKFLAEVLEPDQIPIIQEALGYCLLQAMPIHTSIVLLGEGANGKSTLLNVINAFLGAENVSHVTLQQLCEGRFELAQLHNKLANICDDLPSNSLKSVGNYKNLTGNAPIQGQHKFKDPFNFLSHAKLFFACNKLPPAPEDTVAYYRRFIILNFSRMFTGKNADNKLLEKLTTPNELSGLLNWALEGLKRLLKNGQFTSAKSIEETRSQYIRTADSCLAFIEEQTEISLDLKDYVTDDTLNQQYIAYCILYKLPKKRKADLTIAMQQNRPEAQRTQKRILKTRIRVWQYLKLKLLSKEGAKPEGNGEGLKGVTGVTPVTGFSKLRENTELPNIENREEAVTPVTAVTAEKTCGQCGLWHTGACFISGDPSCVTPNATYALSCRGFKPFSSVEQPSFEGKCEPKSLDGEAKT